MRAIAITIALCSACGRIGFGLVGGSSGDDGNGPGGEGGSSGSAFTLAGAPGHGSSSGPATTTLPLYPLEVGNLQIVVFVFTGSTNQVTALTDNGGNTYARFGMHTFDAGCPTATEVWGTSATATATQFIATFSAGSNVELWLLQLHGAASSPFMNQSFINSAGGSTTPTPLGTNPPSPAAVIAVIGSCGTITGMTPGSPFTQLSTSDGNDTAYALTTTGTSISAAFTSTYATYTMNLIVLH